VLNVPCRLTAAGWVSSVKRTAIAVEIVHPSSEVEMIPDIVSWCAGRPRCDFSLGAASTGPTVVP
jgi:hypothetical protein